MIKKIEGIIVSTVDYKESSKIINILSPEVGVIGVLSRGCKNMKSKLRETSNVLSYGVFHLNYRTESLSSLIEVDIKNSFKNIRKDIVKLNYAVFLLELISGVYKHDRNESVYKMLIDGLIKIDEGYDPRVITSIIELKSLEYLGIKPIVDSCVNCGNKNDIVTISSYNLCKNCVGTEPIYHLKTLKLIRMFYYVDISKISKLDISDNIKKEISLFIDEYYDRYSGLYLKSKYLLEEFTKNN